MFCYPQSQTIWIREPLHRGIWACLNPTLTPVRSFANSAKTTVRYLSHILSAHIVKGSAKGHSRSYHQVVRWPHGSKHSASELRPSYNTWWIKLQWLRKVIIKHRRRVLSTTIPCDAKLVHNRKRAWLFARSNFYTYYLKVQGIFHNMSWQGGVDVILWRFETKSRSAS